MDRTKPGPEAAPTPYGQLHVFGAGERPAAGKPAVEERLARLQQLREKMQKARQDAAARAPDAASEPTQVLVPPPRAPAPAEDAGGAAAVAGRSRPSESPPATTGVQTGFADEGGSRERVPSAAGAAPPAPAPQGARIDAAVPNETAVGVSVANAQGEAEGAQLRDPAAMLPADVPATDPEPPQAVAAIEPPASAPATVPAQAPATSPPVLRRAPGGAPQVAINILQWSAEPARRFAFVSVDGGNVTQVREGDHIGGLTIKHIHQQMIEFGFNDSTFLLRAN